MNTRMNRVVKIAALPFVLLFMAIFAACSQVPYAQVSATQSASASSSLFSESPVLPSNARVGLSKIQMLDAQHGWALGTASDQQGYPVSLVVKTVDGGKTWLSMYQVSREQDFDAFFLNRNVAWAWYVAVDPVSQRLLNRIVVLRTTDGGAHWQRSVIASNGVSAWMSFADQRHGWLEVNTGHASDQEFDKIYRTFDGGASWSLTASSNNPSGFEPDGAKAGITFKDARNGWATGQTVGSFTSLLFVTHDGGVTWNEQTISLSVGVRGSCITLPPTFVGNIGAFTFSCDQNVLFYTSRDGGNSWQFASVINEPSLIPATFLDASHWILSGRTTLYTTADAGRHWKKFSNFPRGILLKQSFVSASTGWLLIDTGAQKPALVRTDNGGRSWQTIHYVVR